MNSLHKTTYPSDEGILQGMVGSGQKEVPYGPTSGCHIRVRIWNSPAPAPPPAPVAGTTPRRNSKRHRAATGRRSRAETGRRSRADGADSSGTAAPPRARVKAQALALLDGTDNGCWKGPNGSEGEKRQIGPRSVREIRADLADLRDLMDQMRASAQMASKSS